MDLRKQGLTRVLAVGFAALAVRGLASPQPLPETVDALNADDVSSADLRVVREALAIASDELAAYFGDEELEQGVRDARVVITVHASENTFASTDRATIRSGTTDGTPATYFAEIHVLALSQHRADAVTASGEPKDAIYMRRLITHELATAWLDLASRRKPGGWRFHSAQDWFVQGYPEFLGLTCAGDAVRDRSLARYSQIAAENPACVDADFGLDVCEPYITGAVLLRFMHEHLGKDKVLAVLTSRRSTFGSAARHELAMGPEQFVEAWRVWLAGVAVETDTSDTD